MIYDFQCDKCNTVLEIEIPISKYDELKNKQFCSKCGEKLTRKLSFEGAINLPVGAYGIDGGKGWNS